MLKTWRPAAYVCVFGLIALYGFIALRGPQGLPALLEKRREVLALQEQVANQRKENQLKREHNQRLRTNPEEQGLEIRKRLHLLQEGETQFIVPEKPKAEEPQAPSNPSTSE